MSTTPNSLPQFKSSYESSGILSVSVVNDLMRMLSNITAEGGISVTTDFGRGLHFIGPEAVSKAPLSFQASVVGSIVTIKTGNIWFSDAVYTIAQGNVTLSGGTEYVYAWHKKNHDESGLAHSSTQPLSLGDRWIWPLVYLETTATGYYIKQILHQGDIFMFSPLK